MQCIAERADLDGDGALLVLVGGEGLALLGGDDGVAGDELGHHPSHSLNAHGQRAHVQQQDVLHLLASHNRQFRGIAWEASLIPDSRALSEIP